MSTTGIIEPTPNFRSGIVDRARKSAGFLGRMGRGALDLLAIMGDAFSPRATDPFEEFLRHQESSKD